MMFEKLAIVGVGLIGGSFAMAAKKAKLVERISGWDDRATIEEALRLGVVDEIEDAFVMGSMCNADLIYLAAPVGGIIEFLQTYGKQVKRGAIVTDAGSTKREICQTARTCLTDGAYFIGGHPMAGSHERGIRHARPDLFHGSAYAVIADEQTQRGTSAIALKMILEAVRLIGAHPIVMDAQRHDRAVAAISHAPQLISTVLALSVADAGDEAMQQLAGAGFADMTRLAASHWSVWEDICETNGDEIAAALSQVLTLLDKMRMELAKGNVAPAGEAFRRANAFIRHTQSPSGKID